MALTKEAVSKLGASVIGHEDIKATVQLPTGLVKTARGLIARPSSTQADTRSGKLYEEQASDEEQPEQPVIQPPPQEEIVPVAVTKRKRRKADAQSAVRVVVRLEGQGDIPSQYTHCYIGEGIAVLGCNEYSYIPAVVIAAADKMTGVLELDKAPGRRYVFTGNTYKDSQNINNILLVELKG